MKSLHLKSILTFIFLIILSCFSQISISSDQVLNPGIEVTYIANSGFLLKIGDTKVLIDALFLDGYGVYLTPSKEIRSRMIGGEPPFDQIDLILVSHTDADHFDSLLTTSALQNHPDTSLVCPEQGYSHLSREEGFSQIRPQIKSVPFGKNLSTQIKINGIEITALQLRHSHDQRGLKQNLGFFILMNGKKIAHFGDADPIKSNFIPYSWLKDENIDLALIPFWFLETEEGRKIIQEIVSPNHMILTHVTPNNRYGEIQVYQQHKDEFKKMSLLRAAMEKKIIRDVP